ncbi:MAG: glycosyltransferase [Treponema sp.]|nr:glycosyltransferase [Treponema sp.]
MENNLLFSVCVITYNQEKYISQALDSILNQEHGFPYEIVIGDDCSSDNTQYIIEEYAQKYSDIIRPIYNTKNLGIIKNYFNVIGHCSGKYIMECAGDDWWLPGKVKKQIDFMEANPDVGMCYGKAQIYKNGKKTSGSFGEKRESFKELLYKGNVIPAVTVCFRREIYEHYANEIEPEKQNWLMEDYPMWLYFAHESKVKFLNTVSAAYRVLENSASHSTDIQKKLSFAKSSYELRLFFAGRYKESLPVWDEEKELFNIYYYQLLDSYTHKKAAFFYDSYLNLHKKSMRERIIIFVSRNFVLFKVFYFFAWMKNIF